MIPKWQLVNGYSKNDLFKEFKTSEYSMEDFIAKGEELYNLKKITCKMKLKRGVREGFVKQIGPDIYKTNL